MIKNGLRTTPNMPGQKLSFKPKIVSRRLLEVLPERARTILEGRYGLGNSVQHETLESIGSAYGITRERVRQIENYALNSIRKSEAYKKEKGIFDELETRMREMGTVVTEEEFLNRFAKDEETRNFIHFLLVLGDAFGLKKEDADFKHRWHVDADVSAAIEKALQALYDGLSDDDLVPEGEFISRFLDHVKHLSEEYKNAEIIERWLALSKKIGKNPLGEWGRASSPNVRTKGIRDYAYLIIKRHGSPMHFREVAAAIAETFKRRAHEATTHNELIKDPRFVLVGRGLYALSEWGYASGVVKDVITSLLKKFGPMSRDQIIERVKKERYVKDNTILVNLQDSTRFRRTSEGLYSLVDL